ncbi:MAG: zinc-binding dehydrogenase [Acidobacteriota bacterium]
MQLKKHGPPGVLAPGVFPDRPPAPGEVAVDVAAAGVNFADILARLGLYEAAPPPPFIPGIEAAGTVSAAGEGVSEPAPGRRVMLFCPFGGYATRVVVKADYVFPIPDDMDFVTAAALPVQYLTAWYGLHSLAGVKQGETVLVHAAAGGVGLAALQLCRAAGVRVYASVGHPAKDAAVLEACPEARIVHCREENFGRIIKREEPSGVDVVMDSVGGNTFARGWKILAPAGRYVLFGAASAVRPGRVFRLAALWRLRHMLIVSPLKMIGENRTLSGFNLFHLAGRRDLMEPAVSGLVESWMRGEIKPKVGHVLPLTSAAEAHRLLQARQTIGKVVLLSDGGTR